MYPGSSLNLNGGTLTANTVDVQSLDGPGLAQVTVNGGLMAQETMRLGRTLSHPDAFGEVLLQAGVFRATELNFLNGLFTQTGGTNVTSLNPITNVVGKFPETEWFTPYTISQQFFRVRAIPLP